MARVRAHGPAGVGWFLLATGALLVSAAPSAAAEPSKTDLAAARDLFSRAEKDEEGGHWSDALEKLRQAAAVKMTPGIRFHIALCEERLGQLVTALGDYTAAQAAARSEGNKEVMDAISEPLIALRARIPTLILTTPVGVQGAEVTLDGAPVATGLLGTAIPVEFGSHAIQGRLAGHAPFSQTVVLTEKQALNVQVRFDALTPPAPAIPAAGGVASEPVAQGSQETRSHSPKAAAIAATAGAVGLIVFGVASYAVAGSKQSTAETACLALPSCDNLKGGVRTWDALALGGWITGAAVGALSIYLWTRPGATAEKLASAQLLIGPTSLGVEGRF